MNHKFRSQVSLAGSVVVDAEIYGGSRKRPSKLKSGIRTLKITSEVQVAPCTCSALEMVKPIRS